MEIIEVKAKDKNRWNKFVVQSDLGSFLQSWQWGEFQKAEGRKIWRLAIIDDNQIVATILLIKHDLSFGKSYLYSPRGPVFGLRNWNFKIGQDLLAEIKKISQRQNAIFLRIEPKETLKPGIKIPKIFQPAGQAQPKNTLILNLEKSSDQLLAQMHQKTRYNIRLAEKRGVKIRISDGRSQDTKIFYRLLSETARRNKIKVFSQKHYQELLATQSQDNSIKLFIAEFDRQPTAAIIVSFFGNEACYLHGASSYQSRNLMAPHLLQWVAILEAKRRGALKYDFWGIAPKNQPKHKWAGVSRFKMGFDGQPINYPGCLDLPYQSFWYQIYRAASFIKKKS